SLERGRLVLTSYCVSNLLTVTLILRLIQRCLALIDAINHKLIVFGSFRECLPSIHSILSLLFGSFEPIINYLLLSLQPLATSERSLCPTDTCFLSSRSHVLFNAQRGKRKAEKEGELRKVEAVLIEEWSRFSIELDRRLLQIQW
ncbi:hypothetical protein Tcan_06050, partial [Toxocara canis]